MNKTVAQVRSAALSPVTGATATLDEVRDEIVSCERCVRLREYARQIGQVKRRAYIHDAYWARPVPGFGDPCARVLIVGLAPAAHGANRTGRVFTGDGAGGSGDFLMTALHRNGFANLPTSRHRDDGLVLTDAFIAAAVRCAPPDNKPTREEILNCLPHLDRELLALTRVQTIVALGSIAFDAYLRLTAARGFVMRPRPRFAHGSSVVLPDETTLIGCYHPSRQNTNTGRLTADMMADVFATARESLSDV
jgi:uracil-DNA glycosylase family 4